MTLVADKVYERAEGGYVAWKSDDPEASSPIDYLKPDLRTALDYLQAEPPDPIRVLVLGEKGAIEEENEFNEEVARWLETATEADLRSLSAAYLSMPSRSEDATWRLIDAHETRDVPTLSDLAELANKTGEGSLSRYVSEKRDSA